MLEKLNNEELVENYNLSTMIRYNHKIKNHDESVAEHSFFVSLFSVKILKSLNLLEDKDIANKVLLLSILHDVGESKISDIPYNVKKMINDLKEKAEKIENEYILKKTKVDIVKLESDVLVKSIVKLADIYSVLQYCLIEKMIGNKNKDFILIEKEANKNIKIYLKKINEIIIRRRKNG